MKCCTEVHNLQFLGSVPALNIFSLAIQSFTCCVMWQESKLKYMDEFSTSPDFYIIYLNILIVCLIQQLQLGYVHYNVYNHLPLRTVNESIKLEATLPGPCNWTKMWVCVLLTFSNSSQVSHKIWFLWLCLENFGKLDDTLPFVASSEVIQAKGITAVHWSSVICHLYW